MPRRIAVRSVTEAAGSRVSCGSAPGRAKSAAGDRPPSTAPGEITGAENNRLEGIGRPGAAAPAGHHRTGARAGEETPVGPAARGGGPPYPPGDPAAPRPAAGPAHVGRDPAGAHHVDLDAGEFVGEH